MQYLLTSDEYNSLTNKSAVAWYKIALQTARHELMKMAEFDCIHDPDGRNNGGYCNGCPCSPMGKSTNRAYFAAICGHTTRYGE